MKEMTFKEFAEAYCAKQESSPKKLADIFKTQVERYSPDGWMLLECQMLGSSRSGDLTILPFGPICTHKTPPTEPVSPSGLVWFVAVIATLSIEEFKKI